jgi:hypothetical protein
MKDGKYQPRTVGKTQSQTVNATDIFGLILNAPCKATYKSLLILLQKGLRTGNSRVNALRVYSQTFPEHVKTAIDKFILEGPYASEVDEVIESSSANPSMNPRVMEKLLFTLAATIFPPTPESSGNIVAGVCVNRFTHAYCVDRAGIGVFPGSKNSHDPLE